MVLIDHGRILYDGGVTELAARFAPFRTLVLRVAGDGGPGTPISADRAAALGAELVVEPDTPADTVRLRFEGGRTAASDLIAALAAEYPVADVSIVEPDLEGVVRQLYGRPEVLT